LQGSATRASTRTDSNATPITTKNVQIWKL
jgi:hypothetical protein